MMLKEVQITSPKVSIDWLYEHLHATNLVVLNGTIPRAVNKDKPLEHQQIPNTRFFDLKGTFSVQNTEFPNTMIDVETFANEVQKLGIHKDSMIVVYDEHGIYASPRVWYMFRSMGFKNIAVLDGGFPAWKAADHPIETKKHSIVPYGDFQGTDNLQLFRNYNDMLQELIDAESVIIDARSSARFLGKVTEPREGLRSGQIPTSKNLPYTEVLHGNTFKSTAELKEIFTKFSLEDKAIIFSCGSGITACILALAAELAGYRNYAVYDGSWTEWGTLYESS